METRKDILWRSYMIYIGVILFGIVIFAKAIYIQRVEGSYWKILSDSLHIKNQDMAADRGTIYSEDGRMLSGSIPLFDIYLDFGIEGIHKKNGELFKKHIDSVAIMLELILKDRSAAQYKRELYGVFNKRDHFHLLKKNVDYKQYKALKSVVFIKENENKNGFIFKDKQKRITPFGILANRTIGLPRQYLDSNGKHVEKSVGLEKRYDKLLRGIKGTQVVRRISGGAFVPIEGSEIEPENGKDIVSTIDVNIQDVTENALMKVMKFNECQNGTCIVMEVKTGKIKAIANLSRNSDGSYTENLNHAIIRSEPGSTFKLVTMLAVLEDQFTSLGEHINIEDGRLMINGRIVKDSEGHSQSDVTVQQAFELSSNVGMAKLVMKYYSGNPQKYIDHVNHLHLNTPTGVDLVGESNPMIPNPKSKEWSSITLPWMSFGYNVAISPLQTLMLYNAVANNGKMMRPYLVKSIVENGKIIQEIKPVVLEEAICSQATLKQLKMCLEGVVKNGTAKTLQNNYYTFAGKTGTAKVAKDNKGYEEDIYQSSFAGYFPAENPKYSCIVVIKNKQHLEKYYGAVVAGPVFTEIANKLFTVDSDLYASFRHAEFVDSSNKKWNGSKKDFVRIAKTFSSEVSDNDTKGEWCSLMANKKSFISNALDVEYDRMPDLKGFGLKDALELVEKQQMQVVATGKGKVTAQSIQVGTPIEKGQTVYLTLGTPTN